ATTASRTSAYHSCSRQRIDLRIDDVPLAPPRGDEVPAQLLADVRDVDVDQVAQRIVVLVEEVLVDLRPADDPAPVQRQQLHQGVLAGGQRHGRAAAADHPGARVDGHVGDADDRVGLAGGPADQGPQAGQQLGQLERLDQVVVGPGVEAADPV